ncbi:MAG: RNA polymerase sigma factor RpoE [Phototrophicales bacterium]
MIPSEKKLIQRAKKGDPSAITTLYEKYADQIYRYIAYRVPINDAEDLTAEVFVKMVEGLPKYTITGAPFEAWLYRIAAARIADYHRRAKQDNQVELSDTLSDKQPLPEDRLLREQELEILKQAVNSLPEEQQTILILRFIERRTHEDVAQIVGKSVSAVKSIQHRALIQLNRLLGSQPKIRHYLRGNDEP